MNNRRSTLGMAPLKVLVILIDEDKVREAGLGENLRVQVSGIEEDDILSSSVLCSVVRLVPAVTRFVAHLSIKELLDNVGFLRARLLLCGLLILCKLMNFNC
ncbi:unnamed protein product [Cuscuta campestris]|uniref:Uncharacterized protein n=1 Tax=Cuscuta campestris TaxID=132261 RepID=A0A484LES3_9ASTE|nr:unnamed protein product [Cuscuta campestris]